MAKETLYGSIELGLGDLREMVTNGTFRLHLGQGMLSWDDLEIDSRKLNTTNGSLIEFNLPINEIALHLSYKPTIDVIYERELHVSLAWNREYGAVHLREGSRFLETKLGKSFQYCLCKFLSRTIPEIQALCAKR